MVVAIVAIQMAQGGASPIYGVVGLRRATPLNGASCTESLAVAGPASILLCIANRLAMPRSAIGVSGDAPGAAFNAQATKSRAEYGPRFSDRPEFQNIVDSEPERAAELRTWLIDGGHAPALVDLGGSLPGESAFERQIEHIGEHHFADLSLKHRNGASWEFLAVSIGAHLSDCEREDLLHHLHAGDLGRVEAALRTLNRRLVTEARRKCWPTASEFHARKMREGRWPDGTILITGVAEVKVQTLRQMTSSIMPGRVMSTRRTRGRSRQSRPTAGRRRGSRRGADHGGGGPSDDGGDPDPPPSDGLQLVGLLAAVVFFLAGLALMSDYAFHPQDPHGRAAIGVKLGEGDFSQAPIPHHPLHLTRAEDIRQAKQDCTSAIRFATEQIGGYEECDPEAARVRAERDYGTGTTVEEAIERNRTELRHIKDELAELAEAPAAYEEGLLESMNRPENVERADRPFMDAHQQFVERYGSYHPCHTQWLIARSAVLGDCYMRHGPAATVVATGWCSDGIWRAGDLAGCLTVDIVQIEAAPVAVANRAPRNLNELIDQRLDLLRRAAIVVRHNEGTGDEGRRAKWKHFIDAEISTLAQTTGIDYAVEAPATEAPAALVERLEEELVVIEAEEEAKLRSWESVNAVNSDHGEVDSEQTNWAAYLEQEAEETRQWAASRRNLIVVRARDHAALDAQPSSTKTVGPLARRCCARARTSRASRVVRRRGRRAASRSPGGDDPPGDSSEPALGRHQFEEGVRV
jgi:hypothetical protein